MTSLSRRQRTKEEGASDRVGRPDGPHRNGQGEFGAWSRAGRPLGASMRGCEARAITVFGMRGLHRAYRNLFLAKTEERPGDIQGEGGGTKSVTTTPGAQRIRTGSVPVLVSSSLLLFFLFLSQVVSYLAFFPLFRFNGSVRCDGPASGEMLSVGGGRVAGGFEASGGFERGGVKKTRSGSSVYECVCLCV